MKAAMYLPGLRPGSMSWPIYRHFAETLREHGIDFTLLSDGPDDAAEDGLSMVPVAEHLGWIDRVASPLSRTPTLAATTAALTSWLRAHPQLDLMYTEIAYPVGAAVHLARRAAGWRGAHVVTPMGEDFLVLPEAAYGFRRFIGPRWLFERTLQASQAIRFISPLAQRELGRFCDRPVALIPLSVAPTTIAAAHRDEARIRAERSAADRRIRERWSLPETTHILVSLGRLHPFKGLHLLVDAVQQLPETTLLVVGPSLRVRGFGDYAAFLQRRARERGVQDRVRFLGAARHEDVLDLLAGAEAVVVPSLLESMNRVCVETAAAGTPFIVTERTGVAGYLERGGIGLCIPAADSDAIVQAVQQILTGRWNWCRPAAREFVDRFDARRVVPALVRLFQRALQR